jgi:hypothetical protein
MMLVSAQACVDYACECVRLAALTDDPDIRAELLEVARSWMQEAQQVGSDANVALAYSGGATQED